MGGTAYLGCKPVVCSKIGGGDGLVVVAGWLDVGACLSADGLKNRFMRAVAR